MCKETNDKLNQAKRTMSTDSEEVQLDSATGLNDLALASDPHAELRKRHATGEYDCYYKMNIESKWFALDVLSPSFNETNMQYKLIKKGQHSEIAQKVIENPDVEVEYLSKVDNHWNTDDNFFANYLDNYEYQLKEPFEVTEPEVEKFHAGESDDVLSVTDDKKAHFAKFGFEVPEFEGEILKEVRDYYVGYSFNEDSGVTEAICWRRDGKAFTTFGIAGLMDNRINAFNLTLMKKLWYEDKSKFPCLMTDSQGHHRVATCRDMFLMNETDGFRQATPEERDSLYVSEVK